MGCYEQRNSTAIIVGTTLGEGKASTIPYSLIETAQTNDLEQKTCLNYLLECMLKPRPENDLN